MLNENLFVTGSSGFLGSYLVDALIEKSYNIKTFDLNKNNYHYKNISHTIGNILDYNHLVNAMRGSNYVFHFASLADIDASYKYPDRYLETNILGTLNVLKACVECGIKKIIFASSVYVTSEYGSFYRISKQTCEKLIEEFKRNYNLKYTVLRFGSLYGPRANEFNSINNMISQAIKSNRISRYGTGKEIREYIHIKDAAELSLKVLSKDYDNEYFMITGKQSIKIIDLLNLIKEILNSDLTFEFDNSKKHHYESTPFQYTEKLAKKISPDPYIDLGQGLLDVINFIKSKNNGNL